LRIVVRRAQEQDLEAINRLTEDLHRYLAGLYGLELSAEELEEEHFDRDELEDVYVAEEAERGVIGYISFSKTETNGWVHTTALNILSSVRSTEAQASQGCSSTSCLKELGGKK